MQSVPAIDFDKTSSCRAINDNGKVYQYRAIELIKICRLFSTGSHQSPDQDIRLQSVLKACDKALEHAVNSRMKERRPTDQEFVNAIRKLEQYEKDFHPNNDPTVTVRMNDAKDKDKKNGKKEWIRAEDKTLRIVCFNILQSPSDENPIIVRQPLIGTSRSPDILWIFSHYAPKKPKDTRDKRYLTLAQNPHFYDGLPLSPTAFVETQPTERYQGTLCVLTNNERRVFLELGKKRRTFDNAWKTNAGNTLIFKDIEGYLEGEAIVKRCIPALPLSCSRMVHPCFQVEAVDDIEDIEDWRAPILELWNSPHIRIHIKIKINCH